MKVIRIIGVAGVVTQQSTPAAVGQYVKTYDPEAHDGRGHLETTEDPAEALRFPSFREAAALVTAVPENHPVRMMDGKPNRPLTAFDVEIADAP